MGKFNKKLKFTYNEDGICSLKYDNFIIYKGRDIDKGVCLLKTYTEFIKLFPCLSGNDLYEKYRQGTVRFLKE